MLSHLLYKDAFFSSHVRTIQKYTHNSGQRHQNLGGQGDQTFAHNTVTCMREEGREGGLGKVLRSLRLVMRLWLLMSFCCDTLWYVCKDGPLVFSFGLKSGWIETGST